MAGSRKNFKYASNLVVGVYAIAADESNIEASQGSGFDLQPADNVIGTISMNRTSAVEPRYVHYLGQTDAGIQIVKTVPWLDPTTFVLANMDIVIFNHYNSDGSIEQVPCRPSIVVGEKFHYSALASDSGILDGDQD